jgi:protein SCO1/2
MMCRRVEAWRLLLAAAVMAVTAAGCASGANSGTEQSTGTVHVVVSQYRGNKVTPPRGKPRIVLTDTSGHRYDFRVMTAGKVTLLFFGYTHCPDECPLTMANTAAALSELTPAQRAQIRVVFVTVDPTRDTGPVLRRWLDHFNTTFTGLTGTLGSVEAAANAAGIPVGKPIRWPDGSYQLDHGTEMLAFSTDNKAYLAFFPSTSPVNMAHDLRFLVADRHP